MSKPSSREAIVETSKIKNINSLKNRSSNQEIIESLLLEENPNLDWLTFFGQFFKNKIRNNHVQESEEQLSIRI